MSRFTFRLQKLLELREWEEKQAASALASALRRAGEAQRIRDTLRSLRERSSRELMNGRAGNFSAGQLQNISYLLARLDERISGAEAKCLAAEGEVKGLRGEYEARFRKRHALDKLREYATEEWRMEEKRAEQKALDEIAVTRFYRQVRMTRDGTGR